MSDEQIDYLTFLNSISDSKDPFTNSGKLHAEVFMYKIFDQTDSILRIYARGLYPELTGTVVYMEGLKNFIVKEGKVNVLLEEDKFRNDRESALNYLLSLNSQNVECRLLKNDSKEKIQKFFVGYQHCNFCTGDDKIFRFEINPNKFEAIGSFNDIETTTKFIKIFDMFSDDTYSTQISLSHN